MKRIADLFCGAGGAGVGLHRAGFEVVGFDIAPQKNYPFEFHQQDALTVDLREFDAVWASPPCQAFSRTRRIHPHSKVDYPDLVEATRERLEGKHSIMENVVTAPLRRDARLCGLMFGLLLIRHRIFESSFSLTEPAHPRHEGTTKSAKLYSSFHHGADYITVAGHNFNKSDGEVAMGIDWMTKQELTQAVPPIYAEYLGRQLLLSI